MVFTKAFAIAAIFATLTAAAPVHQKRAVVYETVTEVDVTTIDTTITIYPGEATPTVASVYTTEAAVTSTTPAVVAPTSTVAPAPAPVADTASSPTQAPPAPAPETTTTAAPVPTTTVAPPAPVIAAAVTSSSSSSTSTSSTSTAPPATSTGTSGSSGSGLSGTGDGTFYDTATSLSAPSYCNTANDGTTENVVALSQEIMDQSLCGATITVTYEGKTATGTVVDKCMGCDRGSVDMSRAMFGDLASLDAGRITVSWSI
ncbi:hypothetical protein EIK77_006931 [Talaromyces pinophilus]|jgi:hypothetical protein|uniref:Asp F7 homolog n=1 Tax=Talaromyces pinophilus TaxID=128442 RepID=A0A6V8HBM6_TALPI|nr:Allergen Asp f 7 [Talaromyces pinophilus]KAI7978596.1 hypothetical protein EIK77_006931 [Talaromyces pinophilus]PCH04747.1 hypothetical protein PENOC_031940 [Penicillium occitanis (nom. inval.)]PCH04876.1 Barwin-related endoglucanase [Penicillium occitanis (nom. inval.)]GAM38857.1 Asp F7 homolog [Talaromyces pinophilus]